MRARTLGSLVGLLTLAVALPASSQSTTQSYASFYVSKGNGKIFVEYGASLSEAADKAKKKCEPVGGASCTLALSCPGSRAPGYAALGVYPNGGRPGGTAQWVGTCGYKDPQTARNKVGDLCSQATGGKARCLYVEVSQKLQ